LASSLRPRLASAADPHAELDAAIGRHIGISLRHLALHLDCAAHRVDDTAKLHEQAIAGGFYNAAAVLLDFGIGQLAPQRLQRGKRTSSSAPISRE